MFRLWISRHTHTTTEVTVLLLEGHRSLTNDPHWFQLVVLCKKEAEDLPRAPSAKSCLSQIEISF